MAVVMKAMVSENGWSFGGSTWEPRLERRIYPGALGGILFTIDVHTRTAYIA